MSRVSRYRAAGERAMEQFRQAAAKRLRRNGTSAEAKLWRALRNRHLARWKFRRQHPIGRYIVDFVSVEGRLIVEIDGATHSEPDEIARDAVRTGYLEGLGYRVVRAWNTDVYDNLDGVIEMIFHALPDAPGR